VRLLVKNADFLEYLSDKLDVMDHSLDDMNQILAVQQEQLKEHMRRSALNEEAVEILKNELRPMQEDWLRVRFLGKLGGFAVGLAAFGYYIVKIMKGG
jgi:hypothetical protein